MQTVIDEDLRLSPGSDPDGQSSAGGACPAPIWGRGSPYTCLTLASAHLTRSSCRAAPSNRPEQDRGRSTILHHALQTMALHYCLHLAQVSICEHRLIVAFCYLTKQALTVRVAPWQARPCRVHQQMRHATYLLPCVPDETPTILYMNLNKMSLLAAIQCTIWKAGRWRNKWERL